MKEYLVLHAAFTLLFALFATIGWNAGAAKMRAIPGNAERSDAYINAQVAVSVLMVALLPELLIVIGAIRRLRTVK